MSSVDRRPGRVDAPTVPIDEDVSAMAWNTSGGGPTCVPEGGRTVKGKVNQRRPGRIVAEAVPIQDEGPAAENVGTVKKPPFARNPWSVVFWAFVGLVSAWLIYATYTSIAEAFSYSVWLATGLLLLTVLFLAALGLALHTEIGAIRRIDALACRAEKVSRAIQENDVRSLLDTLAPTLDGVRRERPELIEEFECAAHMRENCDEIMTLLENVISTDLDRAADREIKNAALKIGASVAVLPHPALDAAVILWRATALTRRLGEIYGLEPSGLSSLRLLKHAITSAIVATGMESAGDAILDEIGRSALASASKGVAEGAVSAMRVYRLGQLTKRLCRL